MPDSLATYLDYGPQAASENNGTSSILGLYATADGAHGAPGTMSTGTAPRVRRRNRMITSCLECRRRKLKCDKSHPCTNCIKFSRDCVFLAPALDSASQLKLTEIKEKMGSLERVLEQDVAMKGSRKGARKGGFQADLEVGEDIDFAPEPEDEKDLEPTPLAVVDAMYDDDADDDLMDLGIALGKLRLTDRLGGFFRPKMSEELTVALMQNERRSSSEKPGSPESSIPLLSSLSAEYESNAKASRLRSFLAPGPTYIAPTSSFFFSTGSHGSSLIDFLPSKLLADRLLQQYWNAVHPIARIVHRPSFQKRYEAFWNEVQMGIEPVGSLQAVIFAAMFAGVVSMPGDIIMRDIGVTKKDLVENFQRGTETALARANLLRTTKIETLQAFVMYMIPLCRDQMSRAHSALCGTAIRLAECMGLHRDGTEYGLNPVETHVRRLIWYQLCFLDIRTCEAQGPRPCIRKDDFDTKFPLNINDDDLDLNSSHIKSADHWTEMTVALIRMECIEMHRVVWIDRPRLQLKKISLTAVLGKIENFRKTMNEKYLQMIDDRIPLQRYGHLVMDVLFFRMHIMVLHRYHNSVAQVIPDRLRQIILTSGTECLEAATEIETSSALRTWAWYAGAHQQYQVAFLLLVEVFEFPMRKEADRIWTVLDYVFEVPSELSREEKARLILTEIRDRVGIYRDARKLRAPTGMLQHLVVQVPKMEGYKNAFENRPSPQTAATSLINPSDWRSIPMANGGPLLSPPSGPSSLAGGSDNTAVTSPSGGPPHVRVSDDLMADIDWNEWDKLFPPEINTGDLNITCFS